MIPIQFVTQRRIVALPPDASVAQASQVMCAQSVGCIMINDSHGHLIGIVTDRDLACAALQKPDSAAIPLSEVMTVRPLTVEQSEDIEHVVHLMEESGIRRIPVVERTNAHLRCIGLITLDDLIASKIIDFDHAARIVQSQIRRRSLPFGRQTLPARRSNASQSIRLLRHNHPTLNQFFKELQGSTGLQDRHLMPVADAVLSAIVRSLHYTGAAHFISLLPEGLQERLLALPAGPDRDINAARLVSDLAKKLGYVEDTMSRILSRFLSSLESLLGATEMENLRRELPAEMKNLFALSEASKKRKLKSA